MAIPATEIDKFRYEAREFVTAMRGINDELARIEDHGVDDTARAVFFDQEFGVDSNNPDITWDEFVAAIFALRAMRTAWDTNKYAIVKLLK